MSKRKYSVEQIQLLVESFIEIATIKYYNSGNDSDAFCINDEIIIKFPRNIKANIRLQNEIDTLKQIQNKFELEIPNIIFKGNYLFNNIEYTFFASKRLKGINLSKNDFLALGQKKLKSVAQAISDFLKLLHSTNNQNSKNDYVLLHGDFSLNHVLFDNGNISGILDFADSKYGNFQEDFKYLLDDDDPEEFGKIFGEMVLEYYLK
jgi:aminoglycoside phosphotransferase (APT) family kinase protein